MVGTATTPCAVGALMPPAPSSAPPFRWCVGVGRAVLARPMLWPVTVRQIARLAPPRWWRRRPFLPVPPAEYMAFRAQTMYGDAKHLPEAKDVITYLVWCRTFPTAPAPGGHRMKNPAVAGNGHK